MIRSPRPGATSPGPLERWRLEVRGAVQGVGFRPFLHRLAHRLGLTGAVLNTPSGARVDIQGDAEVLDAFIAALRDEAPPLARVDAIERRCLEPISETGFTIETSRLGGPGAASLAPDSATCPACLAELRDPAARRVGHPFVSCTDCGPRFTIARALPYDRARTSMGEFPLCAACRREYDDPTDRRQHAQTVACHDCGPRLRIEVDGAPVEADDPIAWAAAALTAGRIGALKAQGGFHLSCRADDAAAVSELRRRKRRPERPLALMVADLDAARRLCALSAADARALEDPRRPVVLLRRRADAPVTAVHSSPPTSEAPLRGEARVESRSTTRASRHRGDAFLGAPVGSRSTTLVGRRRADASIAAGVAPGSDALGLMLPCTPAQHLLLEAVGRPLVMTSGNASGAPTLTDDAPALSELADFVLTHDRAIAWRCDDSVLRLVDDEPLLLRRARGFVPAPIRLPRPCTRPVLAVGGEMKSTFALGVGDQAVLGPHGGDLGDFDAFAAFVDAVERFERLLGVTPATLACDLHPDYAATRWARERAAAAGLELVEVQHHHAHLAACLAEHGLTGPAIGVVFDGTGLGPDGALWGGEFLVGGLAECRRAAHLRPMPLPGGERAIREPWRVALALLDDAGATGQLPASHLDALAPPVERAWVRRMVERGLNTPSATGAGRLFDAVSALLGLCRVATYDGQAAMMLEWAAGDLDLAPYPWDAGGGEPIEIDTRPLVAAVVRDIATGVEARVVAARFHATLAEMVESVCRGLRDRTGLDTVALSGGVFCNARLTTAASARLRAAGFTVLRHHRVPPNDGGLSLGQLAVAAAQMNGGA